MFDLLDALCHTLRMVIYTIIPRNRGYWILSTDKTGSRRAIERYDTEDMAIQRLRVLQANADRTGRNGNPSLPKKPR
jgi:hypothetical protein